MVARITFSFLLIIGFLSNLFIANAEDTIIRKEGIAIINGEARFIDVSKLDQTMMTVDRRTIDYYRGKKKKIIKAGKLIWGEQKLTTYDTSIDDPYAMLINRKNKYFLKIKDNWMYISENNKKWEKLEIKIIDENPPQMEGKYVTPIYMIIYLKCKWFEGYYELIGASDG